jgi:hypothetical protein
MTAGRRLWTSGVKTWGLVGIALLLLPRFGLAHTPGLSTAEFSVQPGGHVDARFVFASGEPLVPRDDLGAFLLDGVDVAADGARCAGTFRGVEPVETDGVALAATYACPDDLAEVEVTLYYLSALPPGHREIVRIVAGSATGEAVLTGDRRALTLRLPNDGQAASGARRRAWREIAVAAFVSAVALALLVWAARTGRA